MKMIKIVVFFLIVLSFSCTKMDIEPLPLPTTQKIFTVSESKVTDGQDIYFDLPSSGVYILAFIDIETGQVISREKFNGKSGENIKKIYTKSIISKYLYLTLSSEDKAQISKTKLILN